MIFKQEIHVIICLSVLYLTRRNISSMSGKVQNLHFLSRQSLEWLFRGFVSRIELTAHPLSPQFLPGIENLVFWIIQRVETISTRIQIIPPPSHFVQAIRKYRYLWLFLDHEGFGVIINVTIKNCISAMLPWRAILSNDSGRCQPIHFLSFQHWRIFNWNRMQTTYRRKIYSIYTSQLIYQRLPYQTIRQNLLIPGRIKIFFTPQWYHQRCGRLLFKQQCGIGAQSFFSNTQWILPWIYRLKREELNCHTVRT